MNDWLQELVDEYLQQKAEAEKLLDETWRQLERLTGLKVDIERAIAEIENKE